MYQKILVPLDGSPAAEQALPFAVELARLSGGELMLARVVPSAVTPPPMYSMAEADTWLMRQAEFRQEAKAYLAVVAGSPPMAARQPACLVPAGPVGETLIQLIEQAGIDLVVMTIRRRGKLARFVMGSTTDHLVHNAPVTVMLVREREE